MEFVDHAFPTQAGFLEVEQDGQIEAGDIKVADHLGDMRLVECGYNLGIDDDLAVHDEIGDELAKEMPAVMDGKLPLLLDRVTTPDEFDDQSVFVELFIKAGL